MRIALRNVAAGPAAVCLLGVGMMLCFAMNVAGPILDFARGGPAQADRAAR